LVVVAIFGGGLTKSQCDLGRIRFLCKGDKGVEAKGEARKSLPPPDGGI
jgi:hypothetical protein